MNQGRINLQFTADIGRANQQIRRLRDEMQRLRKQVQDANEKLEQGANRQTKAHSAWRNRLTSVVAAYVSLDAAISLVNSSLERTIALQDQAH